MNTNIWAKLGAFFYILWGLLHINAARMTYLMAQSLEFGALQGRMQQHAWNLLFFAGFSIVVAVWLNWKNDRKGYWLNAIVISIADIGFILFVLMPGHLPLVPGALGPALWIVALVFSTLGIRFARD